MTNGICIRCERYDRLASIKTLGSGYCTECRAYAKEHGRMAVVAYCNQCGVWEEDESQIGRTCPGFWWDGSGECATPAGRPPKLRRRKILIVNAWEYEYA